MSLRIAGASLAVVGLVAGLGVGFLAGRESARAPATPVVAAGPPRNERPATHAVAAPTDDALVAALRREIAELRAREVRLKMAALGARKPRRTGASPDRPAGTGGSAGTGDAPRKPETPTALLEALRAAFAGGDGPTQAWLRALLEQGLADGSLPAVEVAAWLAKEADPRLIDTLGEALAGLADSPSAELLAGLLAAADQGASDANRMAALRVLSATGVVPPEAIPRLAALAGTGSSDVRMEAINVLARLLEDSEAAGRAEVAALFQRTARTDPDPRLRAEAVMALSPSAVTPGEAQALLDVLRGDRDEDVRATVVGVLPHVSGLSAESRLSTMEQAYAQESSAMVRRMLLSSIVQLGGARAQESLRRMRAVDPAFQQDIDEYLSILGSGVTDGAEVEMRKASLRSGEELPGSGR